MTVSGRRSGMIGEEITIDTDEVPTGTAAYDWTIPREWNIKDAYIKDASGNRIVDFRASNLHVVGYSRPVRARLSLAELRPHLHSIPDHQDWIPYRTSYYSETWGFCLTDRQLQQLPDGQDHVCIDSVLEAGGLTLGQCVLPGNVADEVLISCHICHPSLCNDNLSGVSAAVTLARLLSSVTRRYTYRFVFIPTAIGAVAWLSRHEEEAARVRHGLVLACVGDRGTPTYKRSRRGNAAIDRAVAHVLQHSGEAFEIREFSPYGYDERQVLLAGIQSARRSPVALSARMLSGYHTSADDLDFVDPSALADTLRTCLGVLAVIEGDGIYINRNPKCEPQLGKRGLFGSAGGHGADRQREQAFLWVLNLSDGEHSLLDIAERSGLSFSSIRSAADLLIQHDLLAPRSSADSEERA